MSEATAENEEFIRIPIEVTPADCQALIEAGFYRESQFVLRREVAATVQALFRVGLEEARAPARVAPAERAHDATRSTVAEVDSIVERPPVSHALARDSASRAGSTRRGLVDDSVPISQAFRSERRMGRDGVVQVFGNDWRHGR